MYYFYDLRGVVQLFNAVKQQQKIIKNVMENPSLKQDKIIRSLDEGSFFDILKKTVEKKQTIKVAKKKNLKDEKFELTDDDDIKVMYYNIAHTHTLGS